MRKLNSGEARRILDLFVPAIESDHYLTRLLIEKVPQDVLDARPIPGGKTVADVLWNVVVAETHSLKAFATRQYPRCRKGPPAPEPPPRWLGPTSTSRQPVAVCRN